MNEQEKSEIDIHLAEYNALSEFQRDAKSTFVKVAMYHNTGIVIIVTWLLQHFYDPLINIDKIINSKLFIPVIFVLPVVNSVLIIGCAYQVYSFYCVAKHFQNLRQRLIEILGNNVLEYEDKFGRLYSRERQLSIALDVVAAATWFVIPVTLAFSLMFYVPFMSEFKKVNYSIPAYVVGSIFSISAILYLIGVVIIILRTKDGYFKDNAVKPPLKPKGQNHDKKNK